jgi:hypothetical protein
VLGAGFAANRDLVTFLRYDTKELSVTDKECGASASLLRPISFSSEAP